MQIRCSGCFEMFDEQYEMCPYCGYYHGAPPKEPFELEIGTVLEDRYVIGNEVGLGGFGITYKAWDQKLETVVAIKEYYPSSMVNRAPGTPQVIRFENKQKAFQFGLDRLILEAQYMAQFNTHSNIVHVLSYFEANNTAYIVMEFLDGCTLGEFVQQNGLRTWEQSVDYILQLCSALNEIHKVGIIHRDISPDNIFVCRNGALKLIDFGAARFAQNMESNYTVILKPGFAPPEQYTQISAQGPWTDVYAVGATLYYLVTGQKPEESTNRKTNDTLQPPIAINPDIPQYLSDAIMKAMAIEPHLRFQTIDEFVAVVKKEKKVTSLQVEKRRRWAKRFIGIAALLTVLVFVVGSIIVNLIDIHEDTALEKAKIEVWYVNNEALTLDAAYEQIVENFCDKDHYPNITITTREFASQAELDEALQTGTPNLVQVDPATTDVSDALDLSEIASPKLTNIFEIVSSVFQKNGGNDCVFLKDYAELFPDKTCVPTGFTIPVLYVNSSKVQFKADKIDAFEDLETYIEDGSTVVIDERMETTFRDLFEIPDDASVTVGTGDDFIAGNAAFFLSDIRKFSDVETMPSELTGLPKVVEIRADELPCEWEILWSVSAQSDAQDAAAKRFLKYLLGETAQTILYGQSNGGNTLPVNADALDRFCDYIFDEWEFVPSMTKHCVFG